MVRERASPAVETMTMYHHNAEGFTEEAAKLIGEAMNGTWPTRPQDTRQVETPRK
ncbi:hypothetical protein WME99_29885 [Sorangium sp. So ce136]|uniref:hypothetical protein n=1 Tax=Sorangium sp. So ce136 TaxID=3133284 RepID=UPI003F003E9F